MIQSTRVLVPIRYPITGQGAKTLAHAEKVAQDCEGERVEILVLHVNVIQRNGKAQEGEIRQAVRAIMDETPFTVITRRGFLLEETILEEARANQANTIVVGANQAPRWRRLVSRLFPIGPDIVSYLEDNTGPDVAVEKAASP